MELFHWFSFFEVLGFFIIVPTSLFYINYMPVMLIKCDLLKAAWSVVRLLVNEWFSYYISNTEQSWSYCENICKDSPLMCLIFHNLLYKKILNSSIVCIHWIKMYTWHLVKPGYIRNGYMVNYVYAMLSWSFALDK